MKEYIHILCGIAIVFVITLTMSSCKQGNKPTGAEEPADSTVTIVEEKKAELDYNTTDARSFGLYGCVAKVVTTTYMATLEGDKLVKGIISNRTDSLATFDEKGRVTLDPYANPYVYDADGKFIKGRSKASQMNRDKDGRVISYTNRENENHWEGYSYEFSYDKEGRITTIEWGGWEEGESYGLTYQDGKLYPSSVHIDGLACADIYKTDIRYRYTKFDEQGNWTAREMYFDIMQTTEEYEGNENPPKDYSKEYYIQERIITYY
ncbi:MAG: hypothetical protein IJ888_01735 [Prevotella sp.]|uniref:hypothetical protein n=1 Tax=Prevotella sp. tf2-5 TaxID=1761889 RepID=UPI000B864466|nr:hypothetical protein [Prevotella sp. tf2-5]MBR2243441.1 hypothetical protein [Prevotella sp.]